MQLNVGDVRFAIDVIARMSIHVSRGNRLPFAQTIPDIRRLQTGGCSCDPVVAPVILSLLLAGANYRQLQSTAKLLQPLPQEWRGVIGRLRQRGSR
jgi:hypothetical protein